MSWKKPLSTQKGSPETFVVQDFVKALKRIRAGAGITMHIPAYDRAKHDVVENATEICGSVRLLVVEGNYLLLDTGNWKEVKRLLDEVWYLRVSKECARRRLLQRHMVGGKTQEEASYKVENVDMVNFEQVEGTRFRADLVIPFRAVRHEAEL